MAATKINYCSEAVAILTEDVSTCLLRFASFSGCVPSLATGWKKNQ